MSWLRIGTCLAVMWVCLGTTAHAVVIPLTNDSARTGNPSFGTTKNGPLTDPFAYNPASPGSPLPAVQAYSGPNAAELWHSFNGEEDQAYAVLFDQVYTDIFIDFYARTDQGVQNEHNRDDNLTVNFYNGSWDAGDLTHTETGWAIDNVVASSNRLTIASNIEADRFEIVNNDAINWAIAELRANGAAVPEPSSLILLLLGAAGMAGWGWGRTRRS